MRHWLWTTIAAAVLAGCAANDPLPGHNHPEGAAVDAPAGAATDGAAPIVWKLKVAGAT